MSSVAPKAFRAALVRFAPQFKGYSQQDSQEVRPCSSGTPSRQSWDSLDALHRKARAESALHAKHEDHPLHGDKAIS